MITKFWLYAAIALLALASCVISLNSELIYDDERAARELHLVETPTDFRGMARQAAPLRQITLVADAAIWKRDTMGFRATNLVLHALAALSLLALLRRLFNRQFAVQWAAGLFALMPIGAAAVGVVAHRSEILGTLMMLLACLAWLRPQRTWLAWTVGGVFAVLAAVETSMSLMLPLLLVAYDLLLMAPPQPERARSRWVETGAAALAVSALHVAHCWWINVHGYWLPESWEITPAWSDVPIRLARDWPAGVCVALRWLAIPLPFDYDHGLTPSSWLLTLVGWATLAALVAVIRSQARQRPRLAFGAAWLLAGCAVAALNVFRSRYGAISESELYAVAPGLCLLGGIGIERLCKLERNTTRFWIEIGAAAAAAAVLGAWSNWRASGYGSQEQILNSTLASHPGSGLAHLEKGRYYLNVMHESPNKKVARDHAEKEFQEASDLHWDYYETYGNLGEIAMNRHDYTRAEACYRKAIDLNPASFGARLRLGTALHAQQRYDAAREIYRQLLVEKPRAIDLYRLTADTYEAEFRYAEARPFLEQAQRLTEELRQKRLEARGKTARPADLPADDAPPVITLPATPASKTNALPKRK